MERLRNGLDEIQRRAHRRDAILDAALELFAGEGYQGSTIGRLCQVARVSTKSFYESFTGREDCYLALMRRTVGQIEGAMITTLTDLPHTEAASNRRLIEALATAFTDDPRRAIVLFGHGTATSPLVETERRANRRWAADFLTEVWLRFDEEPAAPGLATGIVGGLFDIVGDWATAPASGRRKRRQDDALYSALFNFYSAARRGGRPPRRRRTAEAIGSTA